MEFARKITRTTLEKLDIEIEKMENQEYLKNLEKLEIARGMVRENLELKIIVEVRIEKLEKR